MQFFRLKLLKTVSSNKLWCTVIAIVKLMSSQNKWIITCFVAFLEKLRWGSGLFETKGKEIWKAEMFAFCMKGYVKICNYYFAPIMEHLRKTHTWTKSRPIALDLRHGKVHLSATQSILLAKSTRYFDLTLQSEA